MAWMQKLRLVLPLSKSFKLTRGRIQMPQKQSPADVIPALTFASKHTPGGCLLYGSSRAGQLRNQPRIPTVPPTPWVLMSTA